MPQLELYYKQSCPFCHKVMNFMEEHGIELPLFDIYADEAAMKRLIEVGGKRQVPCLFIDGTPLYESSDIMAYLAKTFGVDAAEQASDTDEIPEGAQCTIGGGCSF